jgi:hypothetical protein
MEENEMNTAVKMIFSFAAGAAVGSLVAWKILEPKYRRIADEAIADVKARYSVPKSADEIAESTKKDDEEAKDDDEPDVLDEYDDVASAYRSDDGGKENIRDMLRPHYIPFEDFGTFGYKTETLVYYADGVVADEWDNVVDNPKDLIGDDIDEHFDDYEGDAVYIRNDRKKTDYEVCRDLQTFANAMGASDESYDSED